MDNNTQECTGLSLDPMMENVINHSDWITVVTQGSVDFNVTLAKKAVLIERNTLGFFGDEMEKTAEDLKKDSYIEILAHSKKCNHVYKFKGTAESIAKKELNKGAAKKMLNANPSVFKKSRYIITMDLDNAEQMA
jgi:hypothetical protein